MLKPTIPPPMMTTSAVFFMFSIRPRMIKHGTLGCSVLVSLLSTEKTLEPRFIADVMVGRLARWLRMLGFDVLYSNRFEDDEIVRRAAAESRTLLTRDRGIRSRVPPESLIFIEDNDLDSQIRQVLQEFRPTQLHPFTRCPECNDLLVAVDKEEVFERIPPYVYFTQSQFAECRSCRRVYWRGTHADKINTRLLKWTSSL